MRRHALRCGVVRINEFWAMTPAETMEVIEAANWREEQRLKQQVATAWLTANLTRAKRLPALSSLLVQVSRPRKLSGKELRRRRREFRQAAAAENVRRINEHVRAKRE